MHACRVSVNDLSKLADELTNSVVDTSWMLTLDAGTRRAYEKTVGETSLVLTKIFQSISSSTKVAADFGELMVSLGSVRALEMIFSHKSIPIAELWKPQLKQNEGFDFHTVCPTPLVNFGEAKYSGSKNPHGLALLQIDSFLSAEKHLRDHVHLRHLCHEDSITNLDDDRFGVVAAFSINGTNTAAILKNAVDAALQLANKHGIEQVFVVGVSYEP